MNNETETRDELIERIAELADQFACGAAGEPVVYALHGPLDFAEEVIELVTAAVEPEPGLDERLRYGRNDTMGSELRNEIRESLRIVARNAVADYRTYGYDYVKSEDAEDFDNDTDRIIALVTAGAAPSLDAVYRERNQVVSALSKCFYSWIGSVDDAEPGWTKAVYIDLPTGQVSWHIPDSEVQELFGHLQVGGEPWDGHTTEEKYERLAALAAVPTVQAAAGDAPIVPDPRRIDTGYDLPNDERIHEGDVLECDCEGRQLVKWEPLMSSWIVWGMDEFIYFDDDGNEKTFPFDQVTELKEYISWHGKLSTFSRIGNVYDNPELIGSVEMPRKRSAAGDDLDAMLKDARIVEVSDMDGEYALVRVPVVARIVSMGPVDIDNLKDAVQQASERKETHDADSTP